MTNTCEKITFDVSGEYVTETARSWFYKDGKPYEKVEELLLNCLVCDYLSLEERKEIALHVILGKLKITGNTRNNTYRVEEDDSVSELFGTLTRELDKMRSELKETKDDLKEVTNKYLDLYDGVSQRSVVGVAFDDNKRALIDLFKSYGDYSEAGEVSYKDHSTGSKMLDDYLKVIKYEDNYGWLSPSGEFTPVEFGHHEEWATQYVEDNNLNDEYRKWYRKRYEDRKNSEQNIYGLGLVGDFLVYVKNFVLLHSPLQGVATVTSHEIQTLTKKQKDFLFGYYTDRKREDIANKYMID